MHYKGRILGPVHMQVSKEVKLVLLDIKVLIHSEPMFLIGTDALADPPHA